LQTTNMFKNRLPWFLIEPPKCKTIKAISLSGKIKSGQQSFKAFVNKVEMISGMTFADLDTLVDGLTLHLNPAINRLQANIET
ncbi:PRD domain-containing protein, partial [Staphylococcus aureus]|uniref:PRD domain-containing protein n=1 Tax=Staphylococcus aureus TaxID=1280 RepID=UPI001FAFD2EF